jgi:hypothetical protein
VIRQWQTLGSGRVKSGFSSPSPNGTSSGSSGAALQQQPGKQTRTRKQAHASSPDSALTSRIRRPWAKWGPRPGWRVSAVSGMTYSSHITRTGRPLTMGAFIFSGRSLTLAGQALRGGEPPVSAPQCRSREFSWAQANRGPACYQKRTVMASVPDKEILRFDPRRSWPARDGTGGRSRGGYIGGRVPIDQFPGLISVNNCH